MNFFVSERIIYIPEQVFVFGYTPGEVFVNGIMMTFWTSLFWLDIAMIIGVGRRSGFMLGLCCLGYLSGFFLYLGLLLGFGVDPDGGPWIKFIFALIGLYHLVAVFIALFGFAVVTEIKDPKAEQKTTTTTNKDIV